VKYYKLPNYGAEKSFKSLEIEEDNYISTYYINRENYTVLEKVKSPKNSYSISNILKNYYESVDGYLNSNRKKYEAYKKDYRVYDCNYNLKLISLFTIGSLALLSLGVIGLIEKNVLLFAAGVVTFIPSILALAAGVEAIKDYFFYKKAISFINNYDKLETKNNNYQKKSLMDYDNKKVEYTKIKPLKQDYINDNNKVKTLIRSKDEGQ